LILADGTLFISGREPEHSMRRIAAMRLVPLALVAVACGENVAAVCVQPPCVLQVALTVTVTSASAPGAITAAFVTSNPGNSTVPCNQAPGATCVLFGRPGTYALDIGAPGFHPVHRDIMVTGTHPTCGCDTPDQQHLDVALVPVP
jgi:hypothetical protein